MEKSKNVLFKRIKIAIEQLIHFKVMLKLNCNFTWFVCEEDYDNLMLISMITP